VSAVRKPLINPDAGFYPAGDKFLADAVGL